MSTPLVFNIQKFSIHDGPGIRTTIFFKGCPIRCKWCHNPEGHLFEQETMANKDGKDEIVGKKYTLKELIKEAEKDLIFYEQSGGGVTLSGGEVMAQDIDYIEQIAKELHRKGITIVVDTCGVAPYKNFKRLLPYTSLFLYDLKSIDTDFHHKYTGEHNSLVLENLIKLSRDGAKINLRLIILDGLNSDRAKMEELAIWLKENSICIDSINLLPYHDFGRDKYRRLGREKETECFIRPDDATLNNLKILLEGHGYRVAIGGSEINKVS